MRVIIIIGGILMVHLIYSAVGFELCYNYVILNYCIRFAVLPCVRLFLNSCFFLKLLAVFFFCMLPLHKWFHPN